MPSKVYIKDESCGECKLRKPIYHKEDIDYPWICPGYNKRYELKSDIDDCPCWRENKK